MENVNESRATTPVECDICEMMGYTEVPSVGTRVGSDGETYAVCQSHLDAPEELR